MREIEAAADEGHHRALLAHKAFCYQVRKNIGAYVAAMGGIDVLAFTGGIGETSAAVRSLACQGLGYMGIQLDEEKNRNLGALELACRHLDRRFAGDASSSSPTTTSAWSPGKPCAPSSATRSSLRDHRSQEDAPIPDRDLRPPRPSVAGAMSRSCSAPATSSRRNTNSRSPASSPARKRSIWSAPRAASPMCACSARRARKPRSRSP